MTCPYHSKDGDNNCCSAGGEVSSEKVATECLGQYTSCYFFILQEKHNPSSPIKRFPIPSRSQLAQERGLGSGNYFDQY
jgi:hypothetical protein